MSCIFPEPLAPRGGKAHWSILTKRESISRAAVVSSGLMTNFVGIIDALKNVFLSAMRTICANEYFFSQMWTLATHCFFFQP